MGVLGGAVQLSGTYFETETVLSVLKNFFKGNKGVSFTRNVFVVYALQQQSTEFTLCRYFSLSL